MIVYRSSRRSNLNPLWVLIGLNVILFIVTLIAREAIFTLLGFQPATFFSQPWTIVTSLFIHDGFWHIIANMITLYFF